MCIVEDVLNDNNTSFHSYMTYNIKKKSFDMKPYYTNECGIYFILEQDQDTAEFYIHKVGMADGIKGFAGRLSFYWRDQNKRFESGDETTNLIFRVMSNELRDRVLMMYIHPIPYEYTSYCGINGIKKPMVNVRDFERMVSMLSEAEGHPMKLSGQH